MSIQAKQHLTQSIESDIGEYLTAVNTKRVVESVTEQLQGYDVEMIRTDFKAEDDDILKAYIEAKRAEGRSEKTIARYSYMIERAINAIGRPVSQISSEDIRAFLGSEKGRGISGRSIEGMRQILAAFFGWAEHENLIRRSPAANIMPIHYMKKLKKPFSELSIDKLRQACRTTRDRAIIEFLLATGCRVGEVVRLKRDSVNFSTNELTVLGKGNKERIVYISDVAAAWLKRYLDERTDDSDHLFVGKREKLTEQGFRAFLKRLERDSGVSNVHPHRFRRTLATRLSERGMPLQEISYILGHSNVNTTMTYVTINQTQVKSSYQKYF